MASSSIQSDRLAHVAHVRAVKEDSRSIDVVASTDTVDSYGERIDQSTWQLERYLANPVVLYAHDSDDLPIGTASNVGVVDGQLRATITFVSAELNPQAEQVFQLMRARVLRAVSVGFRCHTYRWEVEQDRELLTLADCELLEISVVPVPANPDALARYRSAARSTKSAPAKALGVRKMDSILKALGLESGATEAEALACVESLRSAHGRIVALSGAKSAGEAEAEFRLWKLSHDRVGELEAAEAARVAKAEAEERSALLQQARELGRLSEADRSDPESWVHTLSLDGLRRFAKSAPRLVPVGEKHQEPAPVNPPRPWTELSARERHDMMVSKPELAERLRSGT